MSSRDNWERLVAAVLKREQFLQLCHQQSRSPSISTIASDSDGQILSLKLNSVSPSPRAQLTNPSVSQVSNNALGPITRRLFSAWYQRRKPLVDIPDRHESQPLLNWRTRKGIALGAARGLAHLHYECDKKIIHCDVEAANILLDEDLVAVVADFDVAKITDCDNIDVSTAVRGIIGHIASEYVSTGRCSEKYDVSGYGVFLLELITRQRAFDLARLANDEDMMLLDWVKRKLKERKWETMVDPDCEGNYIDQEVEQLMQIVVLCTQVDPERRLKMSEVVRILEVGDGLAESWEQWCNEEEMLR